MFLKKKKNATSMIQVVQDYPSKSYKTLTLTIADSD